MFIVCKNNEKFEQEGDTMLKEIEFNILNLLNHSKNETHYTQRDMAKTLSVSLGKINQALKALVEKQFIVFEAVGEYSISPKGMEALKTYKVDNAIIMAAGMSSRFAPLSYEKPKGLLNVKGEILIEREIRQLHESGIFDITIVVGYMKEKFFYLEEKFGVKIVVNDEYFKYNNTSTLIRVLDKLSNTYICSSDNYFVENVFEPYVYHSYYSAVYADGDTDEYCLTCNTNGKITKVSIGGCDSWYMLGHVYWDRSFSEKFKQILLKEYDKSETKDQLWENLYMKHIKDLSLYIKKYESDKVLEFDSLEELREFDEEYINNTDSKILKNICNVLNCEVKDITGIKAIKAGLTNTSFQFCVNGQQYVYRHPGRGTEKYINRHSEGFSMNVASKLELDNTFIYMDSDKGWKISKYITNARELNYHCSEEVDMALNIMRRLHKACVKSDFDFNIWNKTEEFINQISETEVSDYEEFQEMYKLAHSVYEKISKDSYAVKCLCHNDCYSPNFLLDNDNNMFLIDWEYSGNDDPASDLGTFICCSDYSFEEAQEIIKQYLQSNPEPDEMRHYIGYVAISSYYWYVWALYQETRGNSVGEWLYQWYKNSKMYAKKTLEMF